MSKRKTIGEKINLWLIAAIIVLLTIVVTVTIIFIRSNRPLHQAREETIQVARRYGDLDTVDKFYWFNRKKTYFTVTGEDTSGKKIVVIVPQKGNKICVLDQSDGLTEAAAKKQISTDYPDVTVEKAELGIYQKQTVWEVSAKNSEGNYNYYLIAFADGKKVKTLNNI